jgi:hypothetical protein
MSKHTPGPWKVETERFRPRDIDYFVVPSNPDSGIAICEIYRKPYKANARLIAAAPELLSALKLAEEAILDAERIAGFGQPMVLSHIRDAIAKAEGKG